jgi:molybdopterin-guanine dinucleotide biosynthesis protein MobB
MENVAWDGRGALPPILSIVGRRNSGKTTLLAALAAELGRRGVRVASIKHSHHEFDIDVPGKDSWRHFHEGGVDAVVVASPTRLALVARADHADRDPIALVRRFFDRADFDLVLVEAFTAAPLPKIEIFRRTVHPLPIWGDDAGDVVPPADRGAPLSHVVPPADRAALLSHAVQPVDRAVLSHAAGRHIAMVTDVPELLAAPFPVFPIDADGAYVAALADWLLDRLAAGTLPPPGE